MSIAFPEFLISREENTRDDSFHAFIIVIMAKYGGNQSNESMTSESED